MAVVGMLLIGAVFVYPDRVMQETAQGEVIFFRQSGVVIWSSILIGLVVGLSQMEQIFRGTRDPFRYQLKFVFLGLGGLAGMGIAQASQMLLLPVWNPTVVWVSGVTSFISLLLIGFGLARWRIHDLREKVQISQQALYTSFTFLIVGGYLLFVGLVAQVIRQTGWELQEALSVLVLFLAGILLVFVVISRQARLGLQQFVGRHFLRSKYDYRQKWLEVTEKFSACHDTRELWDRYLEWLSHTFAAPRISIWKRLDVDDQFHQIRTINTEPPPPPIPATHPVILELIKTQDPMLLKDHGLKAQELGEFGETTQAHVCVPIMKEGKELLGFCTLSRDFHSREYTYDDFDLLRVMAHHVAMLLLQFQLQEERSFSAKWEAVHRFSGFYMHDLKNLAGSLSLLVQNAEQYGNDPDFQASAMRTVKNSTQRILDLIGKLSRQTQTPTLPQAAGPLTPLDVNALVRDVLQGMNGTGCQAVFHAGKDIPFLRLEPESIKQVLLNLVLNARQAMSDKGTLDISTAYSGNDVVVEVTDTGPGMSSDQLAHLFEPFRSSKKTGLGVGLYQCKQIVEERQGRIRVESRLGKGTKIIVSFPVETTDVIQE
jgi:putative PEP-CTERM system histidine kinase